MPDSILQESASTTVEEPVAMPRKPSVRDRESVSSKPLRWMKKGGLAILDNGLISGSNFLLGILLARWLAPEEYGAYALAFSIFILVGFLYQALLLEPLSVFAGSVFRGNLRGYLKKTLWKCCRWPWPGWPSRPRFFACTPWLAAAFT